MKNRIRELRRQRNLTMKELGAVLGLAESTISQYETGKRQPDNEVLLKLGEFFGVSVDYLLGANFSKEKAPADEGERELTMDDFTYAMHNESGDLTDDDKAWLLSMARRIADDNRKRTQKPD